MSTTDEAKRTNDGNPAPDTSADVAVDNSRGPVSDVHSRELGAATPSPPTDLVERLNKQPGFFSDQMMAHRTLADADLIDQLRADRRGAASELSRLRASEAEAQSSASALRKNQDDILKRLDDRGRELVAEQTMRKAAEAEIQRLKNELSILYAKAD